MTIGLFGTCGLSKWREPFIREYILRGIEYYNPQKDDWKEEDAEVEANHLVNDEIILFPVTNETSGLGSLGEVGFSILQAINSNADRDIIVMIGDKYVYDDSLSSLSETVKEEAIVRESNRMRALVKAHLKKLNHPNVYIVSNLDDMLTVSLHLYEIQMAKRALNKYTI